jgi:hypothetical protein
LGKRARQWRTIRLINTWIRIRDVRIGKIDPEVLKVLVGLIQGTNVSTRTIASASTQVQVKLDLPLIDLKLDGLATYLSWSRRIEAALVGKRLELFGFSLE